MQVIFRGASCDLDERLLVQPESLPVEPESFSAQPLTVIGSADGFSNALDSCREDHKTVGLVPTMGYLHEGHVSLIHRARQESDVVAVTIFVNPLQFDSDEDLVRYPRDLEGDLAKAESAGAHYVFAPSGAEMYPETPLTQVHVAGLGDSLEAKWRPGHLDGVATVVAKLFALAGRCKAYFGEKDYQQLAMVRRLTADLSFPIEVIDCPTVREADGLALSSRNARLDSAHRKAAAVVYRALLAGGDAVTQGERDRVRVSRVMREVLTSEPLARYEYAEAVRASDLAAIDPLEGELRLLAAAWIGPVRLIDNIGVQTPATKGKTRCDAA